MDVRINIIQQQMSKYILKDLADLSLSPEVKAKASLILHKNEQGSDDVLRSPIGKGLSTEEILTRFDKVFNRHSGRMNSTLLQLEKSNRDKYGPRSIAKPWSDLKDSFYRQYNLPRKYYSDKEMADYRGELRPLGFENALKQLKNSTNSGLPIFVRKGDIKKDYKEEQFRTELKKKYPAFMFTRTQESGKTRVVWGYPMSDVLYESMFYSPLLTERRKLNWRNSLLGPNQVANRITELINNTISDDDYVNLSIDFSTYDASIRANLQKSAFNRLKKYFQSKYSSDFDEIAERFSTIGMVTPDGVVYGTHGVPSGSTFTNEIDSEVQKMIVDNLNLEKEPIYDIQGDDGAYSIRKSDVSKLFASFENEGLVVNKDKSYKSRDFIVYLQNLFHVDYRQKDGIIYGIYPVYRCLNRILFQERWQDFEAFGISGVSFYSLRTISILENCKHHPLHKEICKFIYDLDKYSLSYNDDEVGKYIYYLNNSSASSGSFSNQYGDDISNIKSFKTSGVLNELRGKR